MQIVLTPEELDQLQTDLDDWHENRLSFVLNNVSKYITNDEDQQALMADIEKYNADNPMPDNWRVTLTQ